jgi:hypothetical protein
MKEEEVRGVLVLQLVPVESYTRVVECWFARFSCAFVAAHCWLHVGPRAERHPPIGEIIRSGALPHLVKHLMRHDSAKLQVVFSSFLLSLGLSTCDVIQMCGVRRVRKSVCICVSCFFVRVPLV